MVRLSSTRGLAARLAAVCAFLGAAACSDAVTSPVQAGDEALLKKLPLPITPAASRLHTGKYRDSSLPHATGRSGSARLEARALLGADGVTRLLVTTGSVDDPDRAPGELAKVQLKVYAPDGSRLFTQNYQRPTSRGSYEFRLPGLPLGSRIEVQANVRGIDRNRTDVVTITETVKRGPGLAVAIDPPAQAVTGVPTVITGTVSETGGQTGSWTSCVLYVEGVEVDRIDHIWVDAGDVVTCAFTYSFRNPGTHNVQIQLEQGPGDTLLTDTPPSASGQVTAQDPTRHPTFTASVMDRTVDETWSYDETWWKPDGSNREYHENTGEASRSQSFALTGSIARAVTFPLATVGVELASGAGVWHSGSWSGLVAVPDLSGQSCVNQLAPEHGAHFYLCSTGIGLGGSTAFGYTRFAGTVTWHSRAFHRQWDAASGTESTYSWNNESEYYNSGGQMRPLGSALSFELRVTDVLGTIPVSGTVPLTWFDSTTPLVPYTCQDDSPYWLDGGVKTVCQGTTRRTFGWSGEISG
ncbi:MAG TPA: hypothetical protein VHG93_07085 [Longimicrobium sp.]|nr:hypothetical protein [Longimicrobium sp.]